MIPSDLAAQLRLFTDARLLNPQPEVGATQRVRAIQSQLPDLVAGQRFQATLQSTLPDGSFRAIVAGRELTLALSTSAKAGDTLELEVTGRTPTLIHARIVGTEGGANTGSTPTALSSTGRMISFLLTGQPPPGPASLAARQPLLPAAPGAAGSSGQAAGATADSAQAGGTRQAAASNETSAGGATAGRLASSLRQAVQQSGLFYEAHQAQWLAGKLDLDVLRQEPQARMHAGLAAGAQSPGIPERMQPLVHQQLDALATQQYVWQGQAWPGQEFEWIVEDSADGRQQEEGGEGAEWTTRLRLTLPHLGTVEAALKLGAAGIDLRLRAEEATAAARLDAGREELARALGAADLVLAAVSVSGPEHASQAMEKDGKPDGQDDAREATRDGGAPAP